MTIPKNKTELKKIIEDEIKLHGRHCDLNHIDTSSITDMSYLFCYSGFNGDISRWNVSNVKIMISMFHHSEFNGDISNWNVTNVKIMTYMFYNAKFDFDKNNNLEQWQPKLAKINDMFTESSIKNKPYWAEYEDIKEREWAINHYVLNKNLTSDVKEKIPNMLRIKL